MSAEYKVRGVENRHERAASTIFRDSRTVGERFAEAYANPKLLGITLIGCAVMAMLLPALLEVMLVIWAIFLLSFYNDVKKAHLPMRMPFEHKGLDYNDPLPGRSRFATKFRKARGIFFLGNEKDTNKELHLAADDMLTHMLLFGTTGAGKTEALLSLSWNSISMGSGLVFIDPKGTNKLGLQVYTLARICGRDDDYLQINFSTGNRDVSGKSPDRLSHTANPFAYGTADSLAEQLVSLIPTSEGENAIFSERAIGLIYNLMRPLVDLRNKKVLELSISTIRDHLTLKACMELTKHPQITEDSRKAMEAYLSSVAGYKESKPYEEQGEDTHKQFGFAQAYFTRALSSLIDTYGHVYGAMMGEVDYPDVVFNRRILVILLPAMEKPPQEIKNLGRIILSGIRGAMSLGLGTKYEGSKADMLDSLPTASNVPNLVIADEYGYVATEGFAVTAAQARGLSFSCVFAGQDYAGFKRGSETEAEQILANTKVKLIMALEDVQSTWDVVRALGSEGYVTNTSGYTMDANALSTSYRDNMNVSIEKRNRVDLMDLRDQIEGEFHVFHKANIVRGQMFHADPPINKTTMQISRMLEIERPTTEYLSGKHGRIRVLREQFVALLTDATPLEAEQHRHHPLPDTIKNTFDLLVDEGLSARMGRRECALALVVTEGISPIPAAPAVAETTTHDDAAPAEPTSQLGGWTASFNAHLKNQSEDDTPNSADNQPEESSTAAAPAESTGSPDEQDSPLARYGINITTPAHTDDMKSDEDDPDDEPIDFRALIQASLGNSKVDQVGAKIANELGDETASSMSDQVATAAADSLLQYPPNEPLPKKSLESTSVLQDQLSRFMSQAQQSSKEDNHDD